MSPNEFGAIVILAALLLGLAVYFGRQQLRALRGSPAPDALGSDDRRYVLRQAYRRLLCTFLMVVFAGMLIGWIFVEPGQRQVREEVRAAQALDPNTRLTEEQKDTVRIMTAYWVGALLVLLVLLMIAALDFWSTVRYGLGQHRKLQAAQRDMLQQHAAHRRQERNGQGDIKGLMP
jgi:phosphatidylglycerophosphate synthase